MLLAVHADKTYFSCEDAPMGQHKWTLVDLPVSRTLEEEGKLQALDGRGEVIGEIVGLGYPPN